jgi:secreted PhoX family phosphatase
MRGAERSGGSMDRRTMLRSAVIGMGALALDPGFFTRAAGAACSPNGPYGPLQAADGNGIRLPAGFSSRVIARSLSGVGSTGYTWPLFPDGGATFALGDGGWVYTANSEVPVWLGGASSISFAADGTITGARRILGGTSSNCAGGATPWGTWLSCEEIDRGYVYECNVLSNSPTRRPALGRFQHEAAAVDGARQVVYLTEDEGDGCFYRVRYPNPNDLSAGTLEVASVAGPDGGAVTWHQVPDPSGASTRTRNQVAAATRFDGGEGIWYGNDVVHFVTKGDNRIWRYDVVGQTLVVVYDDNTSCNPVLTGVDNVVVARSGDVYVAEDGGNMQLVILAPDESVSPFLEVTGQSDSEITGPAFSPDGTRLYFSSQRGNYVGITYEVSGAFR